jgi:hypothetical protein
MADFAAQLLAAARDVVPDATHAAVIWPVGSEEVGAANLGQYLSFGTSGNLSRVDTQGLAVQNALILTPGRVEVYGYRSSVRPGLFRGKLIPNIEQRFGSWPRALVRARAGAPNGKSRRLELALDGRIYLQQIGMTEADQAMVIALCGSNGGDPDRT